jgi:hypothetical protein
MADPGRCQELQLNNARNVIPHLVRVPETFPPHLNTSPLRQHRPIQPSETCSHTTMASNIVPRSALRNLSRAAPSLRSTTPRIATRCLHQQSSPITASRLQHRPTTQSWSQKMVAPSATIARRTMFIQTEPTPNADVCTTTISLPCIPILTCFP